MKNIAPKQMNIAPYPVMNVMPKGRWRLHAAQMWADHGWEMLGTVEDGYGIGALVRAPNLGGYYKINGTQVSALDQRKVAKALAECQLDK